MRSLSWKLSGALLLIAVISVGLTAYLINLNTESKFRQYISAGNMMYAETIADILGNFYEENDSWDDLDLAVSVSSSSSGNQRIIVSDDNGTIIGDSAGEWIGENTDDLGLTDGTAITADDKVVGYVFRITPTSGAGTMGSGMGKGRMGGQTQPAQAASPVISTTDQNFLDEVNDSLWQVGLITLAVALLLGLILTRQIIHPVKTLITGVRNIAKGDLSYRIKVRSHDEIGELAESFNTMASSLEKIEQSRRQLTADIAHELRTPLTVIEGTVNAILDDVYPADREHLEPLLEQSSLLTHLINDLRDISLAESGRLQLNLSQTDLKDLIEKTVTGARVRAKEKNISLDVTAGPDIPEMMIDAHRIEQSVSNLIMNAVRHTPEGGSIRVSLETRGTGVEITVADTGEGILPEDLPHVFERFYRAGSSRSRAQGGTGLGLAITKQMVEAHGGAVSVESTPGKGATFRIWLAITNQCT